MKLFKHIFILVLAWGITSCEMTEFDLQTDPNRVSPDQASVNDLYNNIQLEFRSVYSSAQGLPGSLSRMYHLGGNFNYQGTISPNNLNGLWFNGYSDLFPDIDALLDIAEPDGQSTGVFDIHAASSKIMKAYTLMVMVDLIGDIPLSQAGQGTDVISPTADSGSDVYDVAIGLLDEAIGQLDGTTSGAPTTEMFYGGDADKWITFANTLKLRAGLTTGNGSAVTSAINAGVIEDESEDFEFTYGQERNNPNSRHPFYNSHYEFGDGAYMSNYYMWLLHADKERENGSRFEDPRIRFYFYRKVEDAAAQDQTTYSCHFSILPDQDAQPAHWNDVDPRLPYCIVPSSGYSGRDHLNGEGIPPDGPIRTSYGLYPGGGQFDWDQYEDTRQGGTSGGLGQGIWPIMLSSFVDFMRAEAALSLGTGEDARALLTSGIQKSMDKVFGFKSLVSQTLGMAVTLRNGDEGTVEELFAPDADDVAAYIDFVLAQYDAAGSDEERLAIVIKEYYIAAWGNGLEAYNMYRRTGYPDNMQPALEPDFGQYPRSLLLPDVHVQRNANATQKAFTDQVFWDDGSTDLY